MDLSVFFLFSLGCAGLFVFRTNVIVSLMSIELILFSVSLNFIFFSLVLDDYLGQLFSFLILTVAAAESAIGLAILVVYYRVHGIIAVDYINRLKGWIF